MELLKVVVIIATASVNCGKKLYGHNYRRNEANQTLGWFWIPGNAGDRLGYSVYSNTGASNDVLSLRTN